MTAEQLPAPPAPLHADLNHWVDWVDTLWRVYKSKASRPDWNELRHYGPVPSMRFDPQQPPAADGQPEGVQYVGSSALVALSETFQTARLIPVYDSSLRLVAWTPARPLRLLDVRRDFGAANGATASFSAWPDKERVREWARAAQIQWPEMDGVLYSAKVSGFDSVALFTNAEADSAWPAAPELSRDLTDPALRPTLAAVADKLRWDLDFGV